MERAQYSMKYLLIAYLFVFQLYNSAYAQEQSFNILSDNYNEIYKSVLDEYGFDQVLVNGVFYEDRYREEIGHPFLIESKFSKGTLVFREKEYKGVEINYDIYEQQLVLYITHHNSNAWIIPPHDFISSFSIGDRLFVKYAFQNDPQFYQEVFDSEKLKCLYYWYKLRSDSDHKTNFNSYEFSDSKKKSYLLLNDEYMRYRDNRSFANLFPREIKSEIRKHIKGKGIKVAKSSDGDIFELISYCNSML